MTTFLVAFGVMALIFAGMAVGVIFSNKPIKGSCGGLNALGMKDGCEICGGKDDVCEEEQRKQQGGDKAAKLGRNALDI